MAKNIVAFILSFAVVMLSGSVLAADAVKDEAAQPVNGFVLAADEDVQLEHRGLFSPKTRLTSSAKYSDDEKTARLGLISEGLANSPFFVGTDVGGRWEKRAAYRLHGRAWDVYAGLNVAQKSKLTMRFESKYAVGYRVPVDAPQVVQNSLGARRVSDIGLSYERLDLNDRFYPTAGSAYNLEWAWAWRGLGGDYDFNRFTWQIRGYHAFGSLLTLAGRTKIGWIEGYGKGGGVPYSELFFNGGTSTVRGYRSRYLGPRDTVYDLPLGGGLMWVNNIELRMPVYKKLAGLVFFDFGGLWEKCGDFSAGDLRASSGLGLRYVSKWGALRLDYGWRLRHESGQPPSRLHATFGVPF